MIELRPRIPAVVAKFLLLFRKPRPDALLRFAEENEKILKGK